MKNSQWIMYMHAIYFMWSWRHVLTPLQQVTHYCVFEDLNIRLKISLTIYYQEASFIQKILKKELTYFLPIIQMFVYNHEKYWEWILFNPFMTGKTLMCVWKFQPNKKYNVYIHSTEGTFLQDFRKSWRNVSSLLVTELFSIY